MRATVTTALLTLLVACNDDDKGEHTGTPDDSTAPDDTAEPNDDTSDPPDDTGDSQDTRDTWWVDDTAEPDADGDGFNASDDCDDANSQVYPGAPESCDALDNDCDGETDEGAGSTWYTDADADGYGDDATAIIACEAPAGMAALGGDCDDTDPDYNPGAIEDDCSDPNDYNCDGSVGYTDADGDGYAACAECDDASPDHYPGAAETCDGVDDDCDGEVDEDDAVDGSTWHADSDGDGYGDPATSVTACSAPEGYVADSADCDDADGATYPGATEACDGVDDDCDGEIDEAGAEGETVWYSDADADGYGDASSSTLACTQPEGTSALDGDCDDGDAAYNPGAAEDDCTDPNDYNCDGSTGYADGDGDGYAACAECDDTDADIYPGADERCDGLDDDCDGEIDEAGAEGEVTWYNDADADGYGDADSSTLACTAPEGYTGDDTDCDDTDAATSPGADELCNDLDDDCDGTADDEATDASTWYKDADRDHYGKASVYKVQCDKPGTNWVEEEHTDCDDGDATVHPGADETCDDDDEDCDGVIDDDPIDVITWYIDADGDTYGSADSTLDECDVPSGYTDDDDDCDDTDADVYPGSTETRDGVDNDCDGEADDDLHLGSGADGDLVVSDTLDLSADPTGSRSDADAVAYAVTAIAGARVTVDASVSGIAAGDEVLIINLHGSDTAHSHVGAYEFANVISVSGRKVDLATDVSGTYGETSNDDLSGQAIVLQRVPNYGDVTVQSGGVITTSAWDGAVGGVLAFRASGALTVESGGLITVDGLGYAGGATGLSYNCDSYQGESYAGEGDGAGDGACAAYNEAYGWWVNNYGGGGAHITGGGGDYGGGAEDGDSWTGGSATAPYAGETYGSEDLSLLFLGSGGGGVWWGSTSCTGDGPGPGGDGAGLLFVSGATITTDDSDAITAIGGSSDHCATGSWTYGAGGGAGGSVWIIADTLDLAASSVLATGGTGNDSNVRAGGDGGDGRVRIDCGTCNGHSAGSSRADTALDSAAEPDPGYSASP